jgi:cell division protein FtsZ
MLFEVEQAANRIRAEVDPDANIIFGNTILPEMEGCIRVSVVATGIDAELVKAPLQDKVRTLHPHLNVRQPVRVPQPAPVAAAPQAPANPVHASVDALASQIGAEKTVEKAGDDYVLGGNDAPEISAEPAMGRYTATESYRPLEQQPLARAPERTRAPEKKTSGWGFFGRKKTAPDLRAEPLPEPRASMVERPAPRATAQPPMPQAQAEAPRASADDLFPDHKRDEQFEIPAFLRRQSN